MHICVNWNVVMLPRARRLYKIDDEHDELVKRGWERVSYIGTFGTNTNNYRKQVIK